MDYKPEDLDGLTGKELDETKAEFEQAGIAPAGWGKMRVSDKRSWLKRNLDQFKAAISPATLPAHVREKKAWDMRKREYKALRERHGSVVNKKRVIQFLAGREPAENPEPMTRQVYRQHQRRTEKSALHTAKMDAMKGKRKGGAAAVLSAELV